MDTNTGIIVTMQKDKGFGFIKPDNLGVNLFFHASNVLSPKYEELKIGERVEYIENEGSRGKYAADVAVI